MAPRRKTQRVNKAQQKAVAKYMKNNYDELKIRTDKGQKAIIKAHAAPGRKYELFCWTGNQ